MLWAIVLCLLVALIDCHPSVQVYPQDKELQLLQVIAVHRHGARTPSSLYPNDPWKSPVYWPEGMMQLTAEGAVQLQKLGQLLRSRYADLVAGEFDISDVIYTSTNTTRTIRSAAALISGLYPKHSLPIFVTGNECDKIFNKYKYCPAYAAEKELIYNSPEFLEEEKSRHSLYSWLSGKLGKTIKDITSAEKIFNNYKIETMRGLAQPAWINEVIPEPITGLAAESMAMGAKTIKAQRLRFGPLFKNILTRATAIDRLKPSPKFALYSAHDLNLAGMQAVLNIQDNLPPEFAACLLMEIHWNKTALEKQVKVFYRQNNASDFAETPLPGCPHPCSLAELSIKLEPIIPDNIDDECKLGDVSQIECGQNVIFMSAVALGSFAIGAMFIVVFSKAVITVNHKSGYKEIP